MIKSAIFLLSVFPAVTLAGNGQLSAIGYYHENGIYEPGYANYRFNVNSMQHTTDTYPGIGGSYDDNGVFEAGYVNYRFAPGSQVNKCATADSAGTVEKGVC